MVWKELMHFLISIIGLPAKVPANQLKGMLDKAPAWMRSLPTPNILARTKRNGANAER